MVKLELGVSLLLVWPAQHFPALPGSPSLWFVATSPSHMCRQNMVSTKGLIYGSELQGHQLPLGLTRGAANAQAS